MTAGVCYPSYGREAVFSSTSAWEAEYPVTALNLIDKIRRAARRSAPGNAVIDFLLPASRTVDFIALVHHNADTVSTMTVQLSSGTDPTINVVHLGTESVWGATVPVDGYQTVRPYRLSAPISVRSGRITLSGNGEPWELGAIEIGEWWSWLDVNVDREIGFINTSLSADLGAGVEHITKQWAPRMASGRREVVDQNEVDERLLDFHRARGRHQAFVWCWDVDDSATWPREAFLARNKTLPGGIVREYQVGQMAYDFVEHLG